VPRAGGEAGSRRSSEWSATLAEMPTEPNQLPNSTALVADVLRARAAAQLAQLDGLDSKASGTLGFAGVLLGLLFANSSLTESWNAWMTIGVVSLVVAAIVLAASLWVGKWQVKPTEQKLRSWSSRSVGQTEQLLAASLEAAIVHNRDKVGRKVLAIQVGIALLTFAIAVSAVGLLVARSDASRAKPVTPRTSTVPAAKDHQHGPRAKTIPTTGRAGGVGGVGDPARDRGR